jgi:hypothetical protein
MNRRRPDSGSGNFTVSNNQGDVVIAHGSNARASKSVQGDAADVDRESIRQELARLRSQLADLRDRDPAGLRPEDAAAAEQDVTSLDHEVQRDQPDPDEISRRLGRLSILLGGMAGLAETVQRLGNALRGLIGLG